MAKRPQEPDTHAVVRADGETECQTCHTLIDDGVLCFGEAYVRSEGKHAHSLRYARSERRSSEFSGDDHYRGHDGPPASTALRPHHLRCAANHLPLMLRGALKASGDHIPDREELTAIVDDALVPRDVAQKDPATRVQYDAHIARLQESRDDADFLVFGDWLQSVGDPRGDLIHVQHALETATNEARVPLVDQEKRLLTLLAPVGQFGTLEWRRGFVRAIRNLNQRARVAHPSLVFVRDEDVTLYTLEPTERAPLEKPPAPPPRPVGEWKVRHTRKPEWGDGLVVGGDDENGLEVEFAAVGKKLVKNVELLEEI